MMTKTYTRPKVGEVKDWYTHYRSDAVVVQQAFDPYCDLFRVAVTGGRPKYFFGESAWMDARRLAADVDFSAWTCFD